MKHSNFAKLNLVEAEVLNQQQMKKIKGGSAPLPSLCVTDGTVCFKENNKTYTCWKYWVNEIEYCCCGHDSGADNCEAA